MVHRDLSITAHIPDDAEHRKTYLELREAFERAFARNPGGAHPTRLPIELYDRAKRQGFNMTGYAYEIPQSQIVYISQTLWNRANEIGADLSGFEVQKPIPLFNPTSGAQEALFNRVVEKPMGRTHIGTMAAPVTRKHVADKVCNGKDVTCLPGKDGKCTACDNHD